MYKININTYDNAILINEFSNINQSSVTKLTPIVVGIKAGKELMGYIIRLQINRAHEKLNLNALKTHLRISFINMMSLPDEKSHNQQC